MGFLEDLIARANALLGKPLLADEPTEEFAISHDTYDDLDWQLMVAQVPRLQVHMDELHEEHNYVPHVFEDMFNLLHKGDPKLHCTDEMADRFRPNRDLVAGFEALPDMTGLRLSTMHDKYASVMALLSMQEKLTDAFNHMSQARQAAEQAAQARERVQELAEQLAQALNEALEKRRENEGGTGEGEGEGDTENNEPDDTITCGGMGGGIGGGGAQSDNAAELQQLIEALESALQNIDQLVAEAGNASQRGALDVRSELKEALKEATDERLQEDRLMSSFGQDPGELRRMNFEERRALAERLKNNRLAKFASLFGQFRMVADAERRRKVKHRPDQVVGVELGNDLLRLTSGELLNLAEPALEDVFWQRWASQELVQYKLEGSEKLGQGPIIVVCDESGSMGNAHGKGGTREAWSKALALALCDQAKRAGRDFIYIGFASSYEQWVCEFPGGRAPIAKVIEFCEHFFDGGTHYEAPLEMARQIVDRYGEQDKPKPDVVFITDDEYGYLDPAFLERWRASKTAHSMRCYGIAVGCNTSGALESVADDVRSINELAADPSAMADVFRTI